MNNLTKILLSLYPKSALRTSNLKNSGFDKSVPPRLGVLFSLENYVRNVRQLGQFHDSSFHHLRAFILRINIIWEEKHGRLAIYFRKVKKLEQLAQFLVIFQIPLEKKNCVDIYYSTLKTTFTKKEGKL